MDSDTDMGSKEAHLKRSGTDPLFSYKSACPQELESMSAFMLALSKEAEEMEKEAEDQMIVPVNYYYDEDL
jgi:hypothetical protein